MARPDRIVQGGGVLAGLGGALGTGFFLHVLQVGGDFWTWPGWLALVVTAVGLVVLGLGIMLRDPAQDSNVVQEQLGGDKTRNYQAGRDINLNGKRDDA